MVRTANVCDIGTSGPSQPADAHMPTTMAEPSFSRVPTCPCSPAVEVAGAVAICLQLIIVAIGGYCDWRKQLPAQHLQLIMQTLAGTALQEA